MSTIFYARDPSDCPANTQFVSAGGMSMCIDRAVEIPDPTGSAAVTASLTQSKNTVALLGVVALFLLMMAARR